MFLLYISLGRVAVFQVVGKAENSLPQPPPGTKTSPEKEGAEIHQ